MEHPLGRKPGTQKFNKGIIDIIRRRWPGFLNALPSNTAAVVSYTTISGQRVHNVFGGALDAASVTGQAGRSYAVFSATANTNDFFDALVLRGQTTVVRQRSNAAIYFPRTIQRCQPSLGRQRWTALHRIKPLLRLLPETDRRRERPRAHAKPGDQQSHHRTPRQRLSRHPRVFFRCQQFGVGHERKCPSTPANRRGRQGSIGPKLVSRFPTDWF